MTTPVWIRGHAWEANSYIADNILIDAAVSPEKIEPFKNDIDTIIITHGHFDHIARAREIAELCSAKIFIGEYDLPFLKDESLSLSAHFLKKNPDIAALPLSEGTQIGDFTIYHTPGHTQGSICLFRDSDGVLICGDTVFPNGSYGRTDLPTGSVKDMQISINRIAELPVESIWPGHDIPVPTEGSAHIRLSQCEINRT